MRLFSTAKVAALSACIALLFVGCGSDGNGMFDTSDGAIGTDTAQGDADAVTNTAPTDTGAAPTDTGTGTTPTDTGTPPTDTGTGDTNTQNQCAPACTKVIQCTDQGCPGTLDLEQQACEDQCNPDPAAFQADLIVDLTCDEINEALCPPEPNETDTGDPCTEDTDCEAGDLQPLCFTELDESNEPTGFVGGYCTAVGCEGDTGCGDGNICVQINEQGTTICLVDCSPADNGAGVCRDGYQCPDLSGGAGFGACLPNCTADADCQTGETCNTATGRCE